MLPISTGLATDLYQLTMAAGYWRAGLTAPATFELFVRRLPDSRGYLVAAGLDCALEFLERLAFSPADLTWLRGLPAFAQVPREFFDDYLAKLSFTGDVFAVPEGTPIFPHEPILRVTAPQPEAQLVETALLSIVGFQTSVAAKAARIVDAAAGRTVIEFGARRAHGLESAMAAARAAYLAGFDGTSLVEASRRFGIPVSGTMAHAWIQTFADERAAFAEFNRTFADTAVYLLDTYDTLAAARMLADSNLRPPMVRLDSGDLDALSREVRRILDDAGLEATRIFATSDLDEYRIADLVAAGAPIDGFGVGTAVSAVSDAAALSAVYKLVEVQRDAQAIAVVKLSEGKATWPGAKQIWRRHDDGHMIGDVIAAADEPAIPDVIPLLQPVLIGGRRVHAHTPLIALRDSCRQWIATLPADVRALRAPGTYPVRISETLDRRRTTLLRDRRGAAGPG